MTREVPKDASLLYGSENNEGFVSTSKKTLKKTKECLEMLQKQLCAIATILSFKNPSLTISTPSSRGLYIIDYNIVSNRTSLPLD